MPRACVLVVRRAGAAGSSGSDHWSIHSSSTSQVLLRAFRPVSIPRCPPGTISNRTSAAPVSSGTDAFTEATGAIPSAAPAKTSTGAVMSPTERVRSPTSKVPSTRALPFSSRW